MYCFFGTQRIFDIWLIVFTSFGTGGSLHKLVHSVIKCYVPSGKRYVFIFSVLCCIVAIQNSFQTFYQLLFDAG